MLTWTCEACGRPIADGSGYVTVDEVAASRFPEKVMAWEAEALANSRTPELPMVTGADLLDYPAPVHWETLHAACDPNPDRADYCIGVSRIRTAGAVLGWTAHLWDKDWFTHTDWDEVVRAVAGQLG